MNKIINMTNCSGCSACFNACPKNCITMKESKEGFWYPEIDTGLCINCGMCEKVCPILKGYKGNPKGKAYAAMNKNEDIRTKSSSGGIFTLLAEHIINKGGVVFGAAFDEDFSVKHIAVKSVENLEKLRGSKYLQSEIGDAYKRAKKLLDSGRWVLFSGTPCQISGLKSYLDKPYENLIIEDLICHGVPSPKVWDRYVKFRESRALSKADKVTFRNKKYGWKNYLVSFDFKSKARYSKAVGEDSYMKAFLSDLCLRPSCYDCHSKSLERESDITLADFWGIENVAPDMDDNKGTSLVLINSEKGEKLFDAIKDGIKYKEVDIDEAVRYNSAAYKSAEKPKTRDKFMKEIMEDDFEKTVKKHTKVNFFNRNLRRLKTIVKKIIK